MKNRNNQIGLLGRGCVGKGFAEVLDLKEGSPDRIGKVLVKRLQLHSPFLPGKTTGEWSELLSSDRISTIIEATDAPRDAWKFLKSAVQERKAFVSANKQMVAQYLPEIMKLSQEHGVPIRYEAAVGAEIPVLTYLENELAFTEIGEIRGILNGSSNYILSLLYTQSLTLDESINQAIAAGFAESDPSLDVSGRDAAAKLSILAFHALGVYLHPESIFSLPLDGVTQSDLEWGKARGFHLRQVAKAWRCGDTIYASVCPEFLPASDPLAHVLWENNGIQIEEVGSGTHFLTGRGAGGIPTGKALYQDLLEAENGNPYQWRRFKRNLFKRHRDESEIEIYLRWKKDPGSNEKMLNELNWEGENEAYSWHSGRLTFQKLREIQQVVNKSGGFICRIPTPAPPEEALTEVQKSLSIVH